MNIFKIMNIIDLIIIIPLAWALYKGVTKGFIYSIASLLALILGIIGAIHFSFFAESYIQQWFNLNPSYLPLASFLVTFIIIVAGIHLLAFVFDKLLKAVALGFINRIAGGIFNVIKVAFILSVLLSVVNYLDSFSKILPEDKKENSLLYQPLSTFAPAVFPYLRLDELKERYDNWKPRGERVDELENV